ncbi:MAG: hypothetical protein KIS92_16305 [Planctomycetota bacterium]|nr:hypothetical protein [Planctomycetota bacterium]
MANPAGPQPSPSRLPAGPRPVNSGPVGTKDTSGSLGPPAALPGGTRKPSSSDVWKKIGTAPPKPPEKKDTISKRLTSSSAEIKNAQGRMVPASTVIRPMSTRPGSTSTRISLGSRPATGASHWSCSSCKTSLPMDALVKGMAELQDGKLICARCSGKGQKKEAQRPFGWSVLGIGVAVFAVLSIVFPGQALLILILLSGGAIVVGGASFQMRALVRLVLVAGGILIGAGCIYAMAEIGSQREAREAQAEIDASIQQIEGLLKEDKYNEAQARFMAFDRAIRNPQGMYRSPELAGHVTRLREKFGEWMKKHYGELSEKDQAALGMLLKAYPEGGSLGIKRYRAVRVDDKHAVLAFAVSVDPESKDPQREMLDKAKPVLTLLRESLAGAERIELSIGQNEDGSDAKTYTLEPQHLTRLGLAEMSEIVKSGDRPEKP